MSSPLYIAYLSGLSGLFCTAAPCGTTPWLRFVSSLLMFHVTMRQVCFALSWLLDLLFFSSPWRVTDRFQGTMSCNLDNSIKMSPSYQVSCDNNARMTTFLNIWITHLQCSLAYDSPRFKVTRWMSTNYVSCSFPVTLPLNSSLRSYGQQTVVSSHPETFISNPAAAQLSSDFLQRKATFPL